MRKYETTKREARIGIWVRARRHNREEKAMFPAFQPNPGAIVGWGDDSQKQITGAPPGNGFGQIVAGGANQTMAIQKDGQLALGTGSVGVPLVPSGFRAIAGGISPYHAVAVLNDGSIVYTQPAPPLLPFVTPLGLIARTGDPSISVGGPFCVVIDQNDNLRQWEATGEILNIPRGRFKKVAARNDYAIALGFDGLLYGWGPSFKYLYQPKDGSATSLPGWQPGSNEDRPGFVDYFYFREDGAEFIDIAAGIWPTPPLGADRDLLHPHILALGKSGSVRGWGGNKHGEIHAPAFRFKAIAAGNGFSVGIDEHGFLRHWGIREKAGVTNPKGGGYLYIDPPAGRFRSIGAGSRHAAAVEDVDIPLPAGGPSFPDSITR
jgi:hypothetical protein